MRASVIDLGYNSLKMVSYNIGPDGSFRAYDQRGSLTRLGEGLHKTGFLGVEAMERTLKELALLREVIRLTQVETVLAIATSPVREAANADWFRREAESVLGLNLRILSGKEEALFSYVGAARSTRQPDVLFFDLGGGSLEFTYARGYRVRKILSLPIGALRMSELFGRDGRRFSKKDYERMRRKVAETLPTREELGLNDGTVLLGVGGTIRALAKYDQWIRDYPINKLHNYRIRRKSIASINKRLRKMDPERIAGIESLGRDRAESITAGSLIISTVMNRLGFDEVIVSTHGLRDGVLSEYMRDPAKYSGEVFDESRANSSVGQWHSRGSQAREFYGALASRGVITDREKMVLGEATESFLDLYLNTRAEILFHTILNEDSYLDHGEQAALALSLVRAKAPKTSNWFFSRYRSLLKDWSKGSIDKLAAFARLTEVIELTKSTVGFRYRDGALSFDIATARKDFPMLLLEQAATELEDATGKVVKTAVTQAAEPERVAPVARR